MKTAFQQNTDIKTSTKTYSQSKNDDNSLVQQCFNSSATTYQQRAVLQKDLGTDLLKTLMPAVVNNREIILDLGCGPGLFSQPLSELSEHLISLDASLSMLQANPNSQTKLTCDSHQLSLLDNCVDLVFSNLMIQWCDFETVVNEVYRVLKPGGEAVISTLLPGSLYELQQAWQVVDDDEHIHQYQSLHTIQDCLANMNWKTVETQTKRYTYYYESARALARELKSLGANAVKGRSSKALCGKGKWLAMESAYVKNFADPASNLLPATYRALIIKLKK